jgi:peptidoglycan pentaglycine glycine transferase (the first glycine)
MRVEVCRDFDKYNEVYLKEGLHFLQSWQWGEVKKPLWQPVRIFIENLPVSILIRNLPFSKKKFGYIPRGFSKKFADPMLLKNLSSYCAKELGLCHLIVEPNLFANEDIRNLFLDSGFRNIGKTIQPNFSNIVILDRSYGEVFAKFDSTYRRNIRKSYKIGLSIHCLGRGDDSVDEFYKIMSEIFNRTKFVMHGFEYFKKIWKLFSEAKMAKIYLAKLQDELVGALFVLFDSQGAYEMYGGVSQKGKEVKAGYALRDATIQDAIMLGKKYYDQWGVAEFDDLGNYNKNDELFNISLFKQGFGGKNIRFESQYTMILDPIGYQFYNVGKFLNSFKIKLEKLLK